jgi:hypothetical protein
LIFRAEVQNKNFALLQISRKKVPIFVVVEGGLTEELSPPFAAVLFQSLFGPGDGWKGKRDWWGAHLSRPAYRSRNERPTRRDFPSSPYRK